MWIIGVEITGLRVLAMGKIKLKSPFQGLAISTALRAAGAQCLTRPRRILLSIEDAFIGALNRKAIV